MTFIQSAIEGVGLGMLNDWMQANQAQKLQDINVAGAKKLADYNHQLAMDMWEKTNYEAQLKQMLKAGLNPGLMYKGAGQGGTLIQGNAQASGTAQASAGQAGMGLQIALQAQQTQSQIELNKALAKKAEADATYTGGAQTAQAEADANLMKATEEYTKLQNSLQSIRKDIAEATKNHDIQSAKSQAQILWWKAIQEEANGQVSEGTVEQRIKLVTTEMLNAQLEGLYKQAQTQNVKMNTNLTAEQIYKTAQEVWQIHENVMQGWQGMNLRGQELEQYKRQVDQQFQKLLQEKLMIDFNTTDAKHIQQWVDVAGGLFGVARDAGITWYTMGKGLRGSNPAGFKMNK